MEDDDMRKNVRFASGVALGLALFFSTPFVVFGFGDVLSMDSVRRDPDFSLECGPKRQIADAKTVLSLAFSPEGRRLWAILESDPTVYAWNLAGGTLEDQFKCSGFGGRFAKISPDAYSIVVVNHDSAVALWSIREKKEIGIYDGMPRPCAVDASSRGGRIAVRCWDQSVYSWRSHQHARPTIVSRPQENRYWNLVSISPDGKTLATSEDGNVVSVISESPCRKKVRLGHSNPIRCVAFSPCSTFLAVGDARGVVTIWDLKDNTRVKVLQADECELFSITYTPDGRLMLTGGDDGLVHCWETLTFTCRMMFDGRSGPISAISCSSDNNTIGVGYKNEKVLVWKVFQEYVRSVVNEPNIDWKQATRVLGNADSRLAYTLMSEFFVNRRFFMKYCAAQIRRDEKCDDGFISRLIDDLGGRRYDLREKATITLSGISDIGETQIAQALSKATNLEQKKRLMQIRDSKHELVKRKLYLLRAIEILEHIGDRPSIRVLIDLSEGDPRSMITGEARESLRRMCHRQSRL
jgi:WD domain, G-beta repeat